MAGYWPSFSLRCCLWIETQSRSINTPKKERGQYPAFLTGQGLSTKDLFYGTQYTIFLAGQRIILSGQHSAILPGQVANQSAGFSSSCLHMKLTRHVKKIYFWMGMHGLDFPGNTGKSFLWILPDLGCRERKMCRLGLYYFK